VHGEGDGDDPSRREESSDDETTGGSSVTALPPDPDPSDAPAVADGVEPGDTPPAAAQTSASANRNPPPRRRFTPLSIAAIVVIGLVAAVFLTVAVLYLLQVAGLMDRW
jgi:hypothetical protein